MAPQCKSSTAYVIYFIPVGKGCGEAYAYNSHSPKHTDSTCNELEKESIE